MSIKLVVARPFGRHARGDVIEDPAEMARVLGSEHRALVVRVLAVKEEA
jgi:hypothetical protein